MLLDRANQPPRANWHSACRIARLAGALLAALSAVAVTSGCGTTGKQAHLDAGYAALQQRNYSEAITRADAVLAAEKSLPTRARALYLKGRALEQRGASTPGEAATNLQQARTAYNEALRSKPPGNLEPSIRAGLANVAFWQDDLAVALQQWNLALQGFGDSETRALVMLRIGVCHQRLGQFQEADRIFDGIVREYPLSRAAPEAKQRRGVRTFTVRLATFANVTSADSLVGELRRDGTLATRVVDASGRVIVGAGPYATFTQAKGVRDRYRSRYPDAMISP